jgi:import receptor subunit TOM20
LIERVIIECSRETLPTSPEEKEKYFMEHVAAGETLCGKGKSMSMKRKKGFSKVK